MKSYLLTTTDDLNRNIKRYAKKERVSIKDFIIKSVESAIADLKEFEKKEKKQELSQMRRG